MAKMLQLACMLPRNPTEFWDRIATVVEVKTDKNGVLPGDYSPISWENLVDELDRHVDPRCSTFAHEAELQSIESQVEERQTALPPDAPFARSHNGDMFLGRICYVIARAKRPETVVETGVAYGVTSAFTLRALKVNGIGRLHSVDLPPLGTNADRFVGTLIPDDLTDRWELHRGPSKRVLPPLLDKVGRVDLFVHDSLHTYKTMLREFRTVEPFLTPGAIVISDDVQGNRAFAVWNQDRPHIFSATLQEATKGSLLGISVG